MDRRARDGNGGPVPGHLPARRHRGGRSGSSAGETGGTAQAVSVRGERFAYATSGVYRYNAQRIVAEGIGWDVVTLFGAVPAMLVSAWFVQGSLEVVPFCDLRPGSRRGDGPGTSHVHRPLIRGTRRGSRGRGLGTDHPAEAMRRSPGFPPGSPRSAHG